MAKKLTDTQRVILSHAASRDDFHALPVPKSLSKNAGSLALSMKPLITGGLLAEVDAKSGDAVWKTIDDRRSTLIITAAGLVAIDVAPNREAAVEAKVPHSAKRPLSNTKSEPAAAIPANQAASVLPKEGTKLAVVINLLKAKKGVTISDVMSATGWQRHSVRGAISGALKKKLGLTVDSVVEGERGRVYRIVSEASASDTRAPVDKKPKAARSSKSSKVHLVSKEPRPAKSPA